MAFLMLFGLGTGSVPNCPRRFSALHQIFARRISSPHRRPAQNAHHPFPRTPDRQGSLQCVQPSSNVADALLFVFEQRSEIIWCQTCVDHLPVLRYSQMVDQRKPLNFAAAGHVKALL